MSYNSSRILLGCGTICKIIETYLASPELSFLACKMTATIHHICPKNCTGCQKGERLNHFSLSTTSPLSANLEVCMKGVMVSAGLVSTCHYLQSSQYSEMYSLLNQTLD